jgi:hypothetical protein
VLPSDANAQGRIVASQSGDYTGERERPIIYNTNMSDIPFEIELAPGWRQNGQRPTGINAQGSVIGVGKAPAGGVHGWLVELPLPRPKDRLPELSWQLFIGGVEVDAGGIGILGGKRHPIDPLGPVAAWLPPPKRDVLAVIALGELGAQLEDPELRRIVKRMEAELMEKAFSKALEFSAKE